MSPLSSTDMLEDNIFTWRFNACSGDSWGGTLIADGVAFAPGDSVETAFGTYLIQLEQAFPVDLGSFGLHEGQVLIEWYWHRDSERFLPIRNGGDSVSGMGGLGSEQDSAWTGAVWVPFGLGGTLVVGSRTTGSDRRVISGGPGNDTFLGDLRWTKIDGGPGYDAVMHEANLRSVVLRDRLSMPVAEGPQGIFRSCQEADAADAGCTGKSVDTAGAEKARGTDPPGVLKRSLSREGTDTWVTASQDGGAFDGLRGIEEIRFADATLHFSVDATVAQVTRLYLAVPGRAPDQFDIENWSVALDSGLDLRSATGGFIGPPEFNMRFGALHNAGFVERLYLNVLGKNSEPNGLAYWLNELAQGRSNSDLLIGSAESPENRARTNDVVNAGIVDFNNNMAVVARLYNATLGRNTDFDRAEDWARQIITSTPIDSIVPGFTGSREFQAQHSALADRTLVEHLYWNTPFDEADLTGLNYLAQAMSAGIARPDVVLVFSDIM
jgi:hypothetical protein